MSIYIRINIYIEAGAYEPARDTWLCGQAHEGQLKSNWTREESGLSNCWSKQNLRCSYDDLLNPLPRVGLPGTWRAVPDNELSSTSRQKMAHPIPATIGPQTVGRKRRSQSTRGNAPTSQRKRSSSTKIVEAFVPRNFGRVPNENRTTSRR